MAHRDALQVLRTYLTSQILGQETLVERLLIAVLADGHLLVEGAPGLAKTKAIRVVADREVAAMSEALSCPRSLKCATSGATRPPNSRCSNPSLCCCTHFSRASSGA